MNVLAGSRCRVALVGPYPAANQVVSGGVEAVLLALAAGLASRPDIDLHVVTSVPGLPRMQVERGAGLTIYRAPYPRGDRLLWHQPAVWPVRRALAQIAPDVVHAHMAGHYADAALRSGRPAVTTLHGVIFREAALARADSSLAMRLRWWVDAWFERWVVRRARELIAISPYVANEYRPFTRARFHDIENPVAERFFAIPEASADDAPAALLCVAHVIPRKDILTLLEAFALICAARPAATLEIVGQTDVDPAYTEACRQAVRRLGLDANVRFLGGLNGEALAACYTRADLFLLTSRQETAPVVIAEALAAGRPVVATRVGGVPFMVAEGETGLLVDPGDAAGTASAVLALLRDPARRLAYGRAGRAAAEQRFGLTAVTARTVALYLRLLAEQPGRQQP